MNTTFKTKFLLHLNQKKQQTGEQGFTLIELLVVIIIIGILAAIALPSFLNQANKGKQSEAKQYAASLNKAEQAWFVEKGEFLLGDSDQVIGSLGVGIKSQTNNYKYTFAGNKDELVNSLATPLNKKALKAYTGVVALVAKGNSEKTAQAIVCETEKTDTDPSQGSGGEEAKCGGSMKAL